MGDETNDNYLSENGGQIAKLIASKAGTEIKSKKDKSLPSTDPINQIKNNLNQIRKSQEDVKGNVDTKDEDEGTKRGKKRSKKEKKDLNALSDTDKAMALAYEFYERYKNDELKDVLRWNKQMVSGSKNILL